MLSQTHLLCLSVSTVNRSPPLLSSSTLRSPRHTNTSLTRDGIKKRLNFGIGHVCNALPHNDQLNQVTSLDNGFKIAVEANSSGLCYDTSKEKIKRMFDKVELSISSYDTAWVAMVPSPSSPETPCFPECLNWLMSNQNSDGSWGLHHLLHPLLVKDALSSTLACVLALKRWGVGEEQIGKGLHFIKSNFASSVDDNQHSPTGFDIIFPGMIEYAKDMNFNLDLESAILDGMLHRRDLEIKRLQSSSKGRKKAYLAYVSEGMGKLQDWEMVMKYQKKNGSLFNSPSTTAAALIHLKDPPGCLSYLRSVLKVVGDSVPTIFPLDIYSRLSIVDNLVKLGVDRHFTKEIKTVLDMTYRSWLQQDEEILADVTTCAITYRILLLNGYGVSPDPLTRFFKDGYNDTFAGNMDLLNAALEVYKALELILNTDEGAEMEKTYLWCRKILKNKLFVSSSHTEKFRHEVNDALQFPYHVNLERLRNRRYIEQHYDKDIMRLQKTSYRSPNISNEDFLKLAVEDFNVCQLLQREELKDLHRWLVENKLDRLARVKLSHLYFIPASTVFSPELKDARITWTKTLMLIGIIDDLYDFGGSNEEMLNFIELVSKWDVNLETDCCSDQVRTIFSAFRSTISDIGDNASTCQGRNNITQHIVKFWLDLLQSFLKEATWSRNNEVLTMDDYIANGYISIALGPIVTSCSYFLGQKLSDKVFTSVEFQNMFKLTSISSRFLNDIQSYERESKEGKLINAVSLCMIHSNGAISKEKAVEEIKTIAEYNRKALFRLVFTKQEQEGIVPGACRDLFWMMCRTTHHFYWKGDGFGANLFLDFENEMWNEPIVVDNLSI